MRPETLEFLESIVNVASPSGYELAAADLYRSYVGGLADSVSTDFHGNVHAVLNPDAETRIMLSGHLDEIVFVIHHIDDEGMLYFSPVGGHDKAIPPGQRVWVHGRQRTPGVIGRKPIHVLGAENGGDKLPPIHELWIDIGASSREDAEQVVALGDPVTYTCEFQPLRNGLAAARAFDNRVGVVVVAEALRLLKEEGGLQPGVGVHAVATVQEEIGLRGAITAAFGVDAKTGIAVDVTYATDFPGMDKSRWGRGTLGKGPMVTRGANINPIVFRMLSDAAREDGIPFQVEVEAGRTGTDAEAMQISRGGMATGLLGIPLRYMHSPGEVLSLEDVENCARLMAAYCRRVTPETDFTPRAL